MRNCTFHGIFRSIDSTSKQLNKQLIGKMCIFDDIWIKKTIPLIQMNV